MMNIKFLLFNLLTIVITIHAMDPIPRQLREAELRYRKVRNRICYPDLCYSTSEAQRDDIFNRALRRAKENLSQAQLEVRQSATRAIIQSLITVVGCGVIGYDFWQENNLDPDEKKVNYARICSLGAVHLCSCAAIYQGICDLCEECAQKKIYEKQLHAYQEVEQLHPIQIKIEKVD